MCLRRSSSHELQGWCYEKDLDAGRTSVRQPAHGDTDRQGSAPGYVGFLGDEGEEGVRRAYPPATLKRLAQVKRRYDPHNLFHLNLNVAADMKA